MDEGGARPPAGQAHGRGRRVPARSNTSARLRQFGRTDEGAIHVVEALLAGMIILTAVLFLTNVTKPSPPAAEAGIDLEGVARDVLVVLENRPATEQRCTGPTPDPACYPSRLDQVAGGALGYNVDAAKQTASNRDATDFLDQVIPVGNRWLLRLDNGVEPLVLLPTSGSNVQLTPRAAKAAETFIVPAWQHLAGPAQCGPSPASAVLYPGGPESAGGGMDVQTGHSLVSPTGTRPPAGSSTWSGWWVGQQERFVARDTALMALDPGLGLDPPGHRDRIPPTAMYGWWLWDSDPSDATPAVCRFVGLPDGTATDYPTYGVQLVVWPIAG